MKVTLVSLRAPDAARAAGLPELTPELLAATGARYSRNNEGLESILEKIDPNNPDKSVDSIFRMVDYGHQSIADMAPVSMFIDGISMWLAYQVWSQCPVAGGQESSTRYLRLGLDALVDPEEMGIPHSLTDAWSDLMRDCLEAYDAAHNAWSALAEANPEVTRIPKALLESTETKDQRVVERMQRNFAYDRARYFLPACLRTNMMLVMSARGWVQLIQWLRSHYLPEAQRFGRVLAERLEIATPRLVKHAVAQPSYEAGHREEFDHLIHLARHPELLPKATKLEVHAPEGVDEGALEHGLAFHDHRYAYTGHAIRRTMVRFTLPEVALAEARDLNRHRTGSKYSPAVPTGFYGALDQADASMASTIQNLITEVGERSARQAALWLKEENPEYPYWLTLGCTVPFEHTTTGDKFLYEAELRTGTGAHYRYAKHFRELLARWYEKFPSTKGLIHEGEAEPE